MEEIKVWIWVRVGSISLFLVVILSFFGTAFFLLFSENCCPCAIFYDFDEDRNCFAGGLNPIEEELAFHPNALLLIDVSYYTMWGAGCDTVFMDGDSIRYEGYSRYLDFHIVDEEIYLFDESFLEGQDYPKKKLPKQKSLDGGWDFC